VRAFLSVASIALFLGMERPADIVSEEHRSVRRSVKAWSAVGGCHRPGDGKRFTSTTLAPNNSLTHLSA